MEQTLPGSELNLRKGEDQANNGGELIDRSDIYLYGREKIDAGGIEGVCVRQRRHQRDGRPRV